MKRMLITASAFLSIILTSFCYGRIENGSCPERLVPPTSITVQPGVLTVGLQINFDPINGFNFTDPSTGRPDGFDVRVACLFASCLGLRLVFKNLLFADLIPAVISGGIDIILNQQNRTAERLQRIEQVPYGGTQNLVLVFRNPVPGGLVGGSDLLTAINDSSLSNKTIVVLAGTIEEQILDQSIASGLTNLIKVTALSTPDALGLLSAGNAVAFFNEGQTVESNDPTFAQLVTTTPIPFEILPVSAGIRRDNCDLINAFANFVRLNVSQLQQLATEFTPGFTFNSADLAFTPQVCPLTQFDPCTTNRCPLVDLIRCKFCGISPAGSCNFDIINLIPAENGAA